MEQLRARNSGGVSENVDLITSVMSAREGEMSIKQNETLSFLTFVATVVLPFSLVATILSMQTEYGLVNHSLEALNPARRNLGFSGWHPSGHFSASG